MNRPSNRACEWRTGLNEGVPVRQGGLKRLLSTSVESIAEVVGVNNFTVTVWHLHALGRDVGPLLRRPLARAHDFFGDLSP